MAVIYPQVMTSNRKRSFRVTPQERYDGWWDLMESSGTLGNDPVVSATRSVSSGSVYTTVDIRPRFFPFELAYPGTQAGMEFIKDKFVYVVHLRDAQFLMEVRARGAVCDYRLKPVPAEQERWPPLSEHKTLSLFDATQWLELPFKPGDRNSDFGFFLSPVRLSRRAMEMLLAAIGTLDPLDEACEPFVRAKWMRPTPEAATSVMLVGMPDPFRWMVDAHEDYYIPLLNEWQGWIHDETRQAKLFIASTLKAWIDDGNKLGIANEVTGLETWMAEYRSQEQTLRDEAEGSCAYVAHCLDSPECKIVEAACVDAVQPFMYDTKAVELGHQVHATTAYRLTEMRAGRYVVAKLVKDTERLPRKLLFDRAAGPDYTFALGRYTWTASLQAFAYYYPAFERLVLRAERSMFGSNTVDYCQLMMQRMSLPTQKQQLNLIFMQQRQRFPLKGTPPSTRTMRQAGYQILVAPAITTVPPPNLGYHMSRLHLRQVADAVSFVVEAINLTNAFSQWKEASGVTQFNKSISLIGASGDMAAFLADFTKRYLQHAEWKGASKGVLAAETVGSAAGTVAAICEFNDELAKFMPAADQRNYGEAVGYGIAMAGAVTVAIGSGIALGASLSTIFATAGVASVAAPEAAPIIAAGAAMIAIGTTLAWALTRNEYELFAVRSFLGKDHGNPVDYFPWSAFPIPTPSAVKEQAVLLGLISNFQVTITGSGTPYESNPDGSPNSWIEITPGYMAHDSLLQIELLQTYGTHAYRALIYLYATAGSFDFADGNMMPRLSDAEISADGDKRITKARLPLQPLSLTLGGLSVLYKDNREKVASRCVVRVRLEAGPLSVPGTGVAGTKWLELTTLTDKSVNSFDTSKWKS